MDASTFEELSLHFTEKLSGLTEALAIHSCLKSADEDVQSESHGSMLSLWQDVDELSDILSLIRSKCSVQRETLRRVEAAKENLKALINGLQYTCISIPSHLPMPSTAGPAHGSLADADQRVQTAAIPTPVESQAAGQSNPVAAPTASIQTSTRNGGSTGTDKRQRPPCPLMDYLTVDEFGHVPKYMKGRLSYQQVNAAVDELNKAFTAKYKLMKQKKSTMNDFHRKRYETLKMQESKDTRGVCFLVETDIKEWSSLKMSKETHNLLTLLRHCGRLSEIRGEGHVRYAMIDRY